MADLNNFERVIKEDRAARESKQWRGTLARISRGRESRPDHDQARARANLRPDHLVGPSPAARHRRSAHQAAVQGRAAQGLRFLRRRILRDRAHHRADRPLLPFRVAQGRREPAGPLPDGPGRFGQEFAGRANPARTRADRTHLRDRRMPDERGAAASRPAPSAARVREDARRAYRGRPLPGLPLSAQVRVQQSLRGIPGRRAQLLQAQSRRRRRGAAGRSEQPGHLGADWLGRHLEARPILRGRPARARTQRRAQRRQPRHRRVHRSLQERDRVPARDDHGDAGESDSGARPARHGLRRYLHRRAFERGRVAEVQGRSHQRGDPRSYRRREGAVQPAPVRRGEDLPEDHQELRLPRARRAAHARARLDVRDSVAAGADLEVRSDDQAAALQRRGSRREGTHQENRRAGAEGRHQARRACRASRPASS